MKDVPKAKSLLTAAKRDITFTATLPITEQSAPTIVRNIYESFRMLGEARLALAGIKSADHNTQLQELERLDVKTQRPLATIRTLKDLRNNINYRGYSPSIDEAQNAISLVDACFDPLYKSIKNETEN